MRQSKCLFELYSGICWDFFKRSARFDGSLVQKGGREGGKGRKGQRMDRDRNLRFVCFPVHQLLHLCLAFRCQRCHCPLKDGTSTHQQREQRRDTVKRQRRRRWWWCSPAAWATVSRIARKCRRRVWSAPPLLPLCVRAGEW